MLKSVCRTCGAHVYSMQETGWKAFHTVQESDGHLQQTARLHTQNQQKAHDSHAVEILWKTGKRCSSSSPSALRFSSTWTRGITKHTAASPPSSVSTLPTRLLPRAYAHVSVKSTQEALLPLGHFLHAVSIIARVPHPPTTPPLWSWAFAPGSPPSAIRQRCCKWRDKGPGGVGV